LVISENKSILARLLLLGVILILCLAIPSFGQKIDATLRGKVTDGYKAEYGKASGGVSNIITKAGTNEFHGRAFLFLRDDKLTWISHEGRVLPELRRYEYGGTFGGPIKKNKAWFFGSIELVPEDEGITFVSSQYPIAALEKWVEGWSFDIVP